MSASEPQDTANAMYVYVSASCPFLSIYVGMYLACTCHRYK